MGAHICGYCNCSPCECSKDRLKAQFPPRGTWDEFGYCVPTKPYVDNHSAAEIAKYEAAGMNLPPSGYIRGRPSTMPLPKIDVKDTNPKDAVGIRKWRQFTTVPFTVLWELGVAMLEGARKYGRHNYRIAGVRSSVYVDAAMGHLSCYWEGEDIDELSGLHHVTKAIASLTVLRDSMIQDKYVDDRPPKTKNLEKVKANLQKIVDRMFEEIPEAQPAYLEGDQYDRV